MKLLKTFALVLCAIGFVVVASLLRPAVTASLGGEEKSAKLKEIEAKAATEAKEGKKDEPKGFSFRFGYEKLIPKVTVTKVKRREVSQRVSASGTIRAGSEVSVGAPFPGTVLALAVDEGYKVKKGDLIFALDPKEFQEKVDEAKVTFTLRENSEREAAVELKDATAKIEEREKQGEAPEVKEARLAMRKSALSLEQGKARLETADSKHKRAKLLAEKGLATEADAEAAESELNVAKLQLRLSEEDLQLSKDSLALKLENAERDMRELRKTKQLTELRLKRAASDKAISELTLKRTEEDVRKTRIVSPIAGIVTFRGINSGENIPRADSTTSTTTPQYIVTDFSNIYVYADIDESDVVKVKTDQRVTVRVSAYGTETTLKGKVIDVGYRANKDGETLVFRSRILLESPPETLRPGMTANVEIETERVGDALTLPVQALGQRRRRDLTAEVVGDRKGKSGDTLDIALLFKDEKVEARIVELGLSDGDRVEIKSGLTEEDSVISGPYRILAGLQHGDPVALLPDTKPEHGSDDEKDGKGEKGAPGEKEGREGRRGKRGGGAEGEN